MRDKGAIAMQTGQGEGWWGTTMRRWAWRASTWLLVSSLAAGWFALVMAFDYHVSQGSPETLGWREATYALGLVAAQAVLATVTLSTGPAPVVDDLDLTRARMVQSVLFRLAMTVSVLALNIGLQRLELVRDAFGIWFVYLPMTLPDVCRTIGLMTRTRNRYRIEDRSRPPRRSCPG